jgi:hypothetical protein
VSDGIGRYFEEVARRLDELTRRLDQLDACSVMSYAKSTYVPTYEGSVTAGVTTYTTQVGFYTKIGRVVFFNGFVAWTAATGTGNAVISLPFTPDATANMRYAVSVRTNNVTFANGSVQGRIAPNDARFFLDSPATNAASTAIAVEAAGDIIFSGWFAV